MCSCNAIIHHRAGDHFDRTKQALLAHLIQTIASYSPGLCNADELSNIKSIKIAVPAIRSKSSAPEFHSTFPVTYLINLKCC